VNRRRRSAGFVITLELLLVMVVFVLPLLLGMFVLGRKLVTLYLNQREYLEQPYSRAVVWDSSATPKVIGPVVGYDPYESPLVIFRDSLTDGGVVLGVRAERFTSFGEVFYSDSACTEAPRLRGWSTDRATGTQVVGGVGPLLGNPPVGVMYQMQHRSYAMGSGNILYSSGTPTAGTAFIVGLDGPLFVWKSQDMSPSPGVGLPSPPCFEVPFGTPIETLVAADTVVIDFDAGGNYVAPFRVAFPSAGDPVTMPPSDGGE
jgi:hypothetical protein